MVADTAAQLTDQREHSFHDEALTAAHDRLEALLDDLTGSGVLLDSRRLRELRAFIADVALPVAEAYEETLATTCANCGGSIGARTGWLCASCDGAEGGGLAS